MIQNSKTKGIKVAHNLEDFQQGEEIILTLKDQHILGEDGDLDDQDILENVYMVEKEKQDLKNILTSKSKTAMHKEDKYEQKGQKGILAKYDEVTNEKDGFMLDDEGSMMKNTEQSLEAIRNKLKQKTNNKTTYNTINHNIVAREYNELTDTQKEKKKKTFQKRLQKQKKKEKQNLAQYLEENLQDEDHMANHGTREEQHLKRKKENEAQDLLEKKQKLGKYEAAVESANMDAQKAHLKWQEEEDEMEQQLIQSIEQQRKLKEKFEKEQKEKAQLGENVEEILKENEEVEKEITDKKKQEEEAMSKIQAPKPRNKGQKQVDYIKELSSNQDFLKKVDTEEQSNYIHKMETMQEMSLESQAQGTTSVVQIALPSERQIGRFKRQEELENQMPDMLKELTKEELDSLREETKILHEEDLGTGLTGALKKLREKGMLMDGNYDFRGRNLDEKPHEERHYDPSDRVKLEYKDESGREMTRKQAFRYLCHIFHGKGPSKKTIEKRQKQELEREKIRSKQSEHSSILQKTFKEHQNQNSQAHMPIVFQKNIKKVVN